MRLDIPVNVQREIMIQIMSGNDVELRYINDEFIVVASRKSVKRFSDSGEERIKQHKRKF